MSDQHSGDYGSFGSDPNPTDPNRSDPFGTVSDLTDPSDPTTPTGPQGAYPSARGVVSDTTGFLPALFDFTFTHFVTPKLVRFVYLLATIALAVGWLLFLFTAFAQSTALGLVVLIFGPLLVIIYLAVIRMTLEFYLSIVRMSEDVHHRLPQA